LHSLLRRGKTRCRRLGLGSAAALAK
jgi:hypothetical protein